MESLLQKCRMCPHKCSIDRNKLVGRCKSGILPKLAKADLFFFEEPCISGKSGSGAVFFSNCNLKCVFCQNSNISQEGFGKEITVEELADVFLRLQKRGANNINLVTPTTYVYQIIEALKIAKKKGLNIPIVYNSNGYENVETLKMLEEYVDIYIPDFKYAKDDIALKYSKIPNYTKTAINAIDEMLRQKPKCILDENGLMQKGVIIRHLILPNNIINTKLVLKYVDKHYKNAYFSLMAQYFPTHLAKDMEDINRKLTKQEYKSVIDYFYTLDIQNGYVQELGEHEEEYVPDFDLKF